MKPESAGSATEGSVCTRLVHDCRFRRPAHHKPMHHQHTCILQHNFCIVPSRFSQGLSYVMDLSLVLSRRTASSLEETRLYSHENAWLRTQYRSGPSSTFLARCNQEFPIYQQLYNLVHQGSHRTPSCRLNARISCSGTRATHTGFQSLLYRHAPALTQLGVCILVRQKLRKGLDGFSDVLALPGWTRNVQHRVKALLEAPDAVVIVLLRLISDF